MSDDPETPQPQRKKKPHQEVPQEIQDEIVRLHQAGYGTRRTAQRTGCGRKVIRRVLSELGHAHASTPTASRLDPFRDAVRERVKKGLTTTRILRELRPLGYQGGRTILGQYIGQLRAQLALAPQPKIKRRFETGPAQELQIDWSPFVVSIAGRPTPVHALGCLLCYSRKLYLRLYRDERESTLLEGLASAFEYFEGAAIRVVLDNMATAVLGRIGADRKPLWHPRFESFTRHYGFTPFACAVRDPDRKGKKEKSFRLVYDDFLKGTEFASWDDMDEQRRIWLDHTPEVGNCRIHGTTRRIPNQAWLEERPLLIRLPHQRFPVHEDAVRIVDRDSTLSIRGTPYSVPSVLAGTSVAVRLYAEHFEVLDRHGAIAFSRRHVAAEDKGRLVIDPTHYATLPRRAPGGGASGGGERLDEAFVRRFPDLRPLTEGLQRRFKSLAHIQLRALVRLCDRYGEPAFRAAAGHAQEYRRFDASAVARILERDHPLPIGDAVPLDGTGPAALGEVELGSLHSYHHLDGDRPPAPPATPSKPQEDDSHGT